MKRIVLFLTTAASLLPALAVSANPPTPVAYVSNQNGGVTLIDLARLKKIRGIDVGGKGPRGLGITPDGKYLLTANKDSADVSAIDTATFKIAHRIPIGKNPEFVRVLGDRAYMTYEPGTTEGPPKGEKGAQAESVPPAAVAVLDLQRWAVTNSIPSGKETEGIEFSPKGEYMLVTNEGDNTVTVYDRNTGNPLKTITTQPYGDRPRGIKAAPDGKKYEVYVIDAQRYRTLKVLPGFELPWGVVTYPKAYGSLDAP